MRKIMSFLLCLVICVGIVAPVAAQQEISIIVNGEKIDFDVAPFIENGRTMVPMRAVFEALGAEVSWDDESQSASATRGHVGRSFVIGDKGIYDTKCSIKYPCDVAPKIVGDRTFVPLRAISQSFDCNVGWDEITRTVTVDDKKQIMDVAYETQTITLDTKDEFAKIIVNYIYPRVSDGKNFMSFENVYDLNQLIEEQRKDILNIQQYAADFAEDWQVIIQEKLYDYPNIQINITTNLYASEKYGTVSIVTSYDAPWTGADMLSGTYNKDTLEKMKMAEVFCSEKPNELYDEIYDEFVKMDEYSRYAKEDLYEENRWVYYAVSDDDLYVYMSSLSLTGVGRFNRFYTSVKEY